MWSITDLKQRAWNVLRDFYWKCFLACFIVSLIIYGAGMMAFFAVYMLLAISMMILLVAGGIQANPEAYFPVFFTLYFGGIFLLYWTMGAALTCFLILPLNVGLCRCFMCARNRRFQFGDIFHAFSNRYLHIVKVSFFRYLFLFLWSLLLVIPGIVKYYEYFFVSYILSENPNLSRKRVFELSRLMTDGEKMHIFCFQLSFIGWYLLSALTCGVGFIFLLPYIKAAEAELYAAMRDKLFYEGTSNPQELPGYPC